MEFLPLDIADLIFQSSYWISCLTVKNHVVEKTGHCQTFQKYWLPQQTIAQILFSKSFLSGFFLNLFCFKNIRVGHQFLIMKFFENFHFLNTLFSKKCAQFLSTLFIILIDPIKRFDNEIVTCQEWAEIEAIKLRHNLNRLMTCWGH